MHEPYKKGGKGKRRMREGRKGRGEGCVMAFRGVDVPGIMISNKKPKIFCRFATIWGPRCGEEG